MQNYKSMQLRASLADRTPYRKFLIIVGLILIGAVLSSTLATVLVNLIFGLDMGAVMLTDPEAASAATVAALRMFQGVTALGTFIFPALMAAWLFSSDSRSYLGLDRMISPPPIAFVCIILILGLPVINWMMELNSGLQLPASLESLQQWMKTSEQQAESLTKVLLGGTTIADLLSNLLVIALIPALGEEVMFRGLLQRQFTELTGNRHAGIIVTALLFSAMHFQFFGFFPRFVLGLLMGYLYLWSGSLWLPVAAHFFNNGAAVVLTFLHNRNALGIDPDTFGTAQGEEAVLISSVLACTILMALLYRMLTRNRPATQ